MEHLWEAYQKKLWVEPFLIWSIVFFIVTSFLLYLLIVKSRTSKIKQEKLEKRYSSIIEKLLFAIVFEDIAYTELKEEENYKLLINNTLFRRQIIASVINLHQNYEGAYAKKLEVFYKESGLINNSFRKLKSRKWEIVCSGVNELAEMNVSEAFDRFVKIAMTRNKTLKIVALNACIKLNGAKGIVHLAGHRDPVDEWTQVNIISAIKLHDVEDTRGIEVLLESRNSTVVALGLRIIKSLKLSRKASFVAQLAETAPNNLIRLEAQSVLQSLMM